jgi:hypothetical protein
MQPGDKAIDEDTLNKLKHDIKNQLSGITLVLEQLRYEMPNASAECIDYLDMIALSAREIDAILKSTD